MISLLSLSLSLENKTNISSSLARKPQQDVPDNETDRNLQREPDIADLYIIKSVDGQNCISKFNAFIYV